MSVINETYTLSNGVQIPKFCLGTWFINDKDVPAAVRQTVKLGYLHALEDMVKPS